MLNEGQITTIVTFAETHPDISALYLFGSHALGYARKKSDIDLGVLFDKDVDGFTRIAIETEISNLLKKDVDLTDMRKSSPFLLHQIYKYGKLIYHDGSDFPFQFRATSIEEYLDTSYLRAQRRTHIYG
jgi:predicted nucleotidyltransferase